MDDRFDFQFVNNELLDDVGLDYIEDSYRVFGNDGTHSMGDGISTGTGATAVVLAALEDGSDHLPLVVDYFVPLVGESSCSADLVTETIVRYKQSRAVSSETGILTSSTVAVETSVAVKYYAPEIELDAKFRVEFGGMFRAVIEAVDCNTFSP